MIITPYGAKSNSATESGRLRSSRSRPITTASGIAAVSARPSCPVPPMIKVGLGAIGVTSASRGWARSAADSSAVSSGIGQSIATVSSARLTKV